METWALSGERTLEYVELGEPNGQSVLHMHGTPNTARSAALWDAAARRHDVRLIAVSRPGYGASTTTPPGLASVGDDVLALADALDVQEFSLLGVSGGGPFALATAAQAPDRTRAAVVAAGPGPYHEIAPELLDEADLTAMELLASGDADGAVAIVGEGVARDFGALRDLPAPEFETAFQAMLPPGEPDYFAAHPEDRSPLMADIRRALTVYDGFVRDNLSWTGPWDINLDEVRTRVELSYGEIDHMAPIAHGEWLQERLPSSRTTVHPGAGHGEVCFGLADWQFAVLTQEHRDK